MFRQQPPDLACSNYPEAVFTIEFANKFAKYLVWKENLIHFNGDFLKTKRGQSETTKFSKKFIFQTVKVTNLAKSNVLGKEHVNFSKLQVRHFPREFANSMVNPGTGTKIFPYTLKHAITISFLTVSNRTMTKEAGCKKLCSLFWPRMNY